MVKKKISNAAIIGAAAAIGLFGIMALSKSSTGTHASGTVTLTASSIAVNSGSPLTLTIKDTNAGAISGTMYAVVNNGISAQWTIMLSQGNGSLIIIPSIVSSNTQTYYFVDNLQNKSNSISITININQGGTQGTVTLTASSSAVVTNQQDTISITDTSNAVNGILYCSLNGVAKAQWTIALSSTGGSITIVPSVIGYGTQSYYFVDGNGNKSNSINITVTSSGGGSPTFITLSYKPLANYRYEFMITTNNTFSGPLQLREYYNGNPIALWRVNVINGSGSVIPIVEASVTQWIAWYDDTLKSNTVTLTQ
jgi:hypothetical protein